jgi:endonuclease YncB( thermonuclease family)
MTYRLVQGTFQLIHRANGEATGFSPDGDSIRFHPNKRRNLYNLPVRKTRFHSGGTVQLRFDAIDALEIHYDGFHQNQLLACAARDRVLDILGFKEVDYADDGSTVVRAVPDAVPGYLLTNKVDRNRRVLCYAFAGQPREPDGTQLPLETDLLNQSLNALLLVEGLAYPAYYSGLQRSERHQLTHLANRAMKERRGIWPLDPTLGEGAIIDRARDLGNLVLWPKLFRRLADFCRKNHPNLTRFPKWLRQHKRQNNRLEIISESRECMLDEVVETTQNAIRMRYLPQDLLVVGNRSSQNHNRR